MKFDKAVIRSYVQTNGLLTWCRNPQGCDMILSRGDSLNSGTCIKCNWSSCFSCTFIEVSETIICKIIYFLQAHEPSSCDDMSKWIQHGGFYDGMDKDARSKHLANIISKRCPSCNAQIEKDEGCLQ